MLPPLSKQLGRKPASASATNNLVCIDIRWFYQFLGYSRFVNHHMLKYITVFVRRKKNLTGLVQKFCQLKQKRKFILHYYIIENTSFPIQDS